MSMAGRPGEPGPRIHPPQASPAGSFTPSLPTPQPRSDSGRTWAEATGLPEDVARALMDPRRRIGRYVLVRELGRGGGGAVHEAYDTDLRRPVAIKVLLDASEQQLRRFEREALAEARLRHPSIVAVHEVGVHEGRPFIVMDLIAGEDLEARLRREHLPPRRIAEIVREMALALDHAHRASVLHRDVKPANIIIDDEGRPFLVDFGLARETTVRERVTMTGQVVGTPAYMAPEQVSADAGPQGPATDVYGLGAVLYRALAGRPPFGDDDAESDGSMYALLRAIMLRDPVPVRRLEPNVAPDLETIALRCLEKRPAARYASARALADDLGRFLDGELIHARPVSRPRRLGRLVVRNRSLAAFVFVTSALLVGSTVASVAVVRSSRARLRAERAGRLGAARQEAESARVAFLRARDAAQGLAADRRDDDALLGLGLDALAATGRLAALQPEDELVRRRAFESAMALGEVAVAAEQWSVAASAYRKAGGLSVDDARAAAALDALARTRTAAADGRRRVVDAIIADARSGALGERAGGYEDALFRLVGYGDEQTAEQLALALGGITGELREVTRATILRAEQPDPDEARAGAQPIVGLAAAVDALVGAEPGSYPTGAAKDALLAAARRLLEREMRGMAPERRPDSSSLAPLLAAEQRAALGEPKLLLARLCCEALARIGRRGPAVDAIAGYLFAEGDERRAAAAGIGLCLLGGERAQRLVMASREYFGADGAYWTQVSRYLPRLEDEASSIVEDMTPRELLEAGGLLAEKAQLEAAIQHFTRAIALRPDLAAAWHRRASARRQKGDLPAALADASRAIELAPEQAGAWAERGLIRAAMGEPRAALADLDRAVELRPKDVYVFHNRGNVRRAAGDLEGSLADFGRVLQLDPGRAGALNDRALTRRLAGDLDGALADHARAIETDPELAASWAGRGEVHRRRGELDAALADLLRASELAPANAMIWVNRAVVRIDRGELRAAVQELTRATELDPRLPQAWHDLGVAHNRLGELEQAERALTRAIELTPEHAELWRERGGARGGRGDLRGAIEDLTRAIELDPRDAGAYINRGLARKNAGDLPGGLVDLSRAVELAPELAIAWLNRGVARKASGDADGALADYDRAIALDPRMAAALTNRGVIRAERGDLAGAVEDYGRAAEINPHDANTWSNLGIARLGLGDGEGAVAACARGIEVDPRHVLSWYNRGVAHRALGRLEKAVEDYTRALELAPALAEAWSDRGGTRHDLGDMEGAINDCTRALKLQPGLAVAWANRAAARFNTGDHEGARADATRAIELAPRLAIAWCNRAAARAELGELDEAIVDYTRAINIDRELAFAYRGRGLTRVKKGDKEGAVSDLEKFLELRPLGPQAEALRAELGKLR